MIPRLALVLLGMLLATDASSVDYVRLSPSEFAQDLQKASLLLEQHDYAAAVELLEVLVADEPKDADALGLLGFALRKRGIQIVRNSSISAH
jgi:Flp pilus assembly protein TadD